MSPMADTVNIIEPMPPKARHPISCQYESAKPHSSELIALIVRPVM